MFNDEYAVQLTIDYSSFKSAIKNITALWDNLSDKTKEKFSLDFESDMDDIKETQEQLKVAEKNFNDLLKQYQKLGDMPITPAIAKQLEELERQLKNAKGDVDSLKESLNEKISGMQDWVGSLDKTRKRWNLFHTDVKNSKGLLSQIPDTFQKMGLAIIGVRSTFMLFRKIVSSALSQNVELSNKFQAIWNSLGRAITPILEKIINMILKAFTYLSAFVKALTGGKVDLLANTSKSARATAGSLKEANKQLAGFDEINNLDTGSSGGGGIGGISNPFEGVDVNTEWTKAFMEFGEYMKTHWPAVVTLLGLTYMWLQKIGGLTGLWTLLGNMAQILAGIGLVVGGVILLVEDFKAVLEDPSWENWGKVIQDIGVIVMGFGLIVGNQTAFIVGAIVLAVGTVIKNFESIKQWWADNKQRIIDSASMIGKGIQQIFSANWRDGIRNILKGAFAILDTVFPGIYNGAKALSDGIKRLFNGNWKDAIVGIFRGLGNMVISILNGLIRGINAMAYPIRKLIVGIGSVLGRGWTIESVQIPQIPYLATGTNYVPNDQLAMIHKGEAVIPKKFNSSEYFNNDDVLEKLDRFMEIVEDIDFNTYLDGKKVSKEVTRYQRQQERIMGGAY